MNELFVDNIYRHPPVNIEALFGIFKQEKINAKILTMNDFFKWLEKRGCEDAKKNNASA